MHHFSYPSTPCRYSYNQIWPKLLLFLCISFIAMWMCILKSLVLIFMMRVSVFLSPLFRNTNRLPWDHTAEAHQAAAPHNPGPLPPPTAQPTCPRWRPTLLPRAPYPPSRTSPAASSVSLTSSSAPRCRWWSVRVIHAIVLITLWRLGRGRRGSFASLRRGTRDDRWLSRRWIWGNNSEESYCLMRWEYLWQDMVHGG